MFQVFFFDRKPKHEYYKPNNSAAAVTYKKNWIGKRTNKQTKNILKKRNETKRFFKGEMNKENKQIISLKMSVGKCAVFVGLVDQLGFVLPTISKVANKQSIILRIEHSELFLLSSPPHSFCFPSFSSLSVISGISDSKILRLGHILRTVQ